MANIGAVRSITQIGTYEPFGLQVSRGQIQGHERICPFGLNSDISTSLETVWQEGGAYTFPAAATVMTVSSSSTDDDGSPAGTGARTVVVEGLNASYAEISETITMNGTTAVNTVNSYLRVNKMYVATGGTTAGAVGNIYIGTGTVTTGKPAVVYNMMGIGTNTSESLIYTVPAGSTAYLLNFAVSSSNSTANASTSFRVTICPNGGVFQIANLVRVAGNGSYSCEAIYPFPVPEKSDINVLAAASAGNSAVSAQLQAVVIANAITGSNG
jgi:hypothetical protein